MDGPFGPHEGMSLENWKGCELWDEIGRASLEVIPSSPARPSAEVTAGLWAGSKNLLSVFHLLLPLPSSKLAHQIIPPSFSCSDLEISSPSRKIQGHVRLKCIYHTPLEAGSTSLSKISIPRSASLSREKLLSKKKNIYMKLGRGFDDGAFKHLNVNCSALGTSVILWCASASSNCKQICLLKRKNIQSNLLGFPSSGSTKVLVESVILAKSAWSLSLKYSEMPEFKQWPSVSNVLNSKLCLEP